MSEETKLDRMNKRESEAREILKTNPGKIVTGLNRIALALAIGAKQMYAEGIISPKLVKK